MDIRADMVNNLCRNGWRLGIYHCAYAYFLISLQLPDISPADSQYCYMLPIDMQFHDTGTRDVFVFDLILYLNYLISQRTDEYKLCHLSCKHRFKVGISKSAAPIAFGVNTYWCRELSIRGYSPIWVSTTSRWNSSWCRRILKMPNRLRIHTSNSNKDDSTRFPMPADMID